MAPLHRHQLARLHASGWRAVEAQVAGSALRECLALWAARGLPLVVGRQCGQAMGSPVPALRLGLAAPAAWQRQRLSLQVDREHVGWFDEFPLAADIAPWLPRHRRASWRQLCHRLHAGGATARVYGSHGWQAVTGLSYLHPRSDIDLWVSVQDPTHADAMAAVLADGAAAPAPCLDGELCFPDGRAVAWREWRQWRRGEVRQVLVKCLDGAWLADRWTDGLQAERLQSAAA